MKQIRGFQKEFRFLSNFWPVPIIYYTKNLTRLIFPTVEHFYQARKTMDISIQSKISNLPTPGEAKRFAKTIKQSQSFPNDKVGIMWEGVWQKFSSYPNLKEKLIATGNAEIIEENTWGDTFWGVCNGTGKNMLGNILMDIREKLSKNNTLIFTTSQYSIQNHATLDITRKGAESDLLGSIFAPPKELVNAYLYNGMTQQEYSVIYGELMQRSYNTNTVLWNYILTKKGYVNLICFCKPGNFCHRLLLANMFKNMGATYLGEITHKN